MTPRRLAVLRAIHDLAMPEDADCAAVVEYHK